jgi:hypothetical protein
VVSNGVRYFSAEQIPEKMPMHDKRVGWKKGGPREQRFGVLESKGIFRVLFEKTSH